MLTPRDYQLQAVEDCRAQYRQGARSVLLVLPTGGGKTMIGSLVVAGALERQKRVLWLAGRRELVHQAAARMPIEAGLIMAGEAKTSSPVQVASIDTLTARGQTPDADLVVVDEAHHATATTWRRLLEQQPQARILGLTATPVRHDGAALGDIFERMVLGPSIAELTRMGHLVPCDVIAPAYQGKLAMQPVDAWMQRAGGHPGFAFHRTITESQRFVAELSERGVSAAHVDGETATSVRQAAIEAFRAGEVECLSSVQVFTEGVDVPRATVCLLARGCSHAGTFLQMVGRVLRPHPGKHRALLIDLRGSVHEHGLPEAERTWSLEGRQGVPQRSPSLHQCATCGSVWAEDRRDCPACGYVAAEKPPEVRERALQPVKGPLQPHAAVHVIRRHARSLMMIAASKGYKQGWVHAKLRAIYGQEALVRAGV